MASLSPPNYDDLTSNFDDIYFESEMSRFEKLKEFLDNYGINSDWDSPITTSDTQGVDYTKIIDKYNKIENLTTALNNYWNKSVKDFADKLQEILSIFDSQEKSVLAQGFDAGNNFNSDVTINKEEYVIPFINKKNQNYIQQRQDSKEEVLKNEIGLSYTDKVLKRLLMPQNQRNVEIEDLNRNFWIIGQYLTHLNSAFNSLVDFPEKLKDIMIYFLGELMGLWDNIHKLYESALDVQLLIQQWHANQKPLVVINYTFEEDDIQTQIINDDLTISYVDLNSIIDDENHWNDVIQVFPLELREEKDTIARIKKQLKTKNFFFVSNEDKTIWDLLSFNQTGHSTSFKICDKGSLSRTLYTDEKYYFKNLWVNFEKDSESDNVIASYTENIYSNVANKAESFSKIVSFDSQISIPLPLNYSTDASITYRDLIRLGNPYPDIIKISWTNIEEHLASLKDSENWLVQEDSEEDNPIYIDGFYGGLVINDDKNLSMQVSSSDMISCTHDKEGQTQLSNTYFPDSWINADFVLRYLNGKVIGQDLEILSVKDITGDPIKHNFVVETKSIVVAKIGAFRRTEEDIEFFMVNKDNEVWYTDEDLQGGDLVEQFDGNEEGKALNLNYLWEQHGDDFEDYIKSDPSCVNLENDHFVFFSVEIGTNPARSTIGGNIPDSITVGEILNGLDSANAGTCFAYLCVAYKTNNEILIKRIGNVGLSYNFFDNSMIKQTVESLELQSFNDQYEFYREIYQAYGYSVGFSNNGADVGQISMSVRMILEKPDVKLRNRKLIITYSSMKIQTTAHGRLTWEETFNIDKNDDSLQFKIIDITNDPSYYRLNSNDVTGLNAKENGVTEYYGQKVVYYGLYPTYNPDGEQDYAIRKPIKLSEEDNDFLRIPEKNSPELYKYGSWNRVMWRR